MLIKIFKNYNNYSGIELGIKKYVLLAMDKERLVSTDGIEL